MSASLGFRALVLAAVVSQLHAVSLWANPPVPGTGTKQTEVGDDFEDAKWEFVPNLPKASANLDQDSRYPIGESTNGRIIESAFRGGPDIIRRIPTPAGGLQGSKGALFVASKDTGIPGQLTREMQQDDLIVTCSSRLGGHIPPEWYPNILVRVHLPPFEKWEKRGGSHFGFRADVEGPKWTPPNRRFFAASYHGALESFWPGIFFQFNRKAEGHDKDHAVLVIRSDALGQDFVAGPRIEQPGWWTLGMSFTPDGQTHYFASPGVDPLTSRDWLTSQTPYQSPVRKFNSFFFNIVNQDDGRTWSTAFVIDDPELYYTQR